MTDGTGLTPTGCAERPDHRTGQGVEYPERGLYISLFIIIMETCHG